jgi:hypothetical protein
VHAAGELGVAAHAEESARRMLAALIHPDGYTVEVKFSRIKARPGHDTMDRAR